MIAYAWLGSSSPDGHRLEPLLTPKEAASALRLIVSPRCSFNISSIALIAVRPASATAAASTCDRRLGFFATTAALTEIVTG